MIPFTKPTHLENEIESLLETYKSNDYSKAINYVNSYLCASTNSESSFFCNSCSDALEIAALAIEIKEGDEIIVPDYTFVTSASAFALRKAKIIFCDVMEDLCIDLSIAKKLITKKTKAIVWVDYAGSTNRIEEARNLCDKYDLVLIQDSAQSVGGWYTEKKSENFLGDFITFSFHSTKNITSGGEGGALVLKTTKFKDITEIIFEKGTNRRSFIRNEVDKYTWQKLGSSYAGSYAQASLLLPQLKKLKEITSERRKVWQYYYDNISLIKDFKKLGWKMSKLDNIANGHIFWIIAPSANDKESLLDYFNSEGIQLASHYQSLSLSPAGKINGSSPLTIDKSIEASNLLLRLPIWFGIDIESTQKVIKTIDNFFKTN